MMILEMYPYNADADIPATGWDEAAIQDAMAAGKQLYIDQYGDVWTDGQREYIGKTRKEMIG